MRYLDLQGNSVNYLSVGPLSDFLKITETLEYVNLTQCNLRGKIAEQIIDAIMLNKSLQYLDIASNHLTSPRYTIAAKLGRLLQGHPGLLHVNCAHN